VDAGVRFSDAPFERSGKWRACRSPLFLRLLCVISPYSAYQIKITRKCKITRREESEVYLKVNPLSPSSHASQGKPAVRQKMQKT
jgi:hypothetical protein